MTTETAIINDVEVKTTTMTVAEYKALNKRSANKRAKADAEFQAHMQERVNTLKAESAKRLAEQETHNPRPELTFEYAVTEALDAMRPVHAQPTWNLATYPNSTSWCKMQYKNKTKFTCQANQKAVVLVSQKRVTDEILEKYAHKIGKQNQFDFRPETPEELKNLLIDLMTCNS